MSRASTEVQDHTVTDRDTGRVAMKRAAIIGAGTMGPGMGAVLARAGMVVTIYDVSPEALERAKRSVELAGSVLDRLGMPVVEGGTVRFARDLADALAEADIVLEAVPERLELKQALFSQFEQQVEPTTILASNTSGIPISKIASVCTQPERVVGMHWSNPPHLIPMIEVIPGERTSQETVTATVALVRCIGYYPVVEREVPGFVENRILYAIMREALDLVDRGIIDPEGMDLCVRWGIGYKLAVIGPMELLDMAGLDIYESVASYLNQDLCASSQVSETIRALTSQGRLGMKTGSGIYNYTPEQIEAKQAERAAKLIAVRKALSQ
jgi:3-hydroxyacyl-CoA dehydrogenase